MSSRPYFAGERVCLLHHWRFWGSDRLRNLVQVHATSARHEPEAWMSFCWGAWRNCRHSAERVARSGVECRVSGFKNGTDYGSFCRAVRAWRSRFGLVIVDSLEILSSRAAPTAAVAEAAGCFARRGPGLPPLLLLLLYRLRPSQREKDLETAFGCNSKDNQSLVQPFS